MTVGVGQSERLAIERDAHNNLFRVTTQLHPVAERVIGVKECVDYFRMGIKWRYVARRFVPVSKIVVRHDADPVQVTRNGRNVVAGVNDGL